MGVVVFSFGCLCLVGFFIAVDTWNKSDYKKELDREEICRTVEKYYPSSEDCESR